MKYHMVMGRDIIHSPNGKITYSKPYITIIERGEEE